MFHHFHLFTSVFLLFSIHFASCATNTSAIVPTIPSTLLISSGYSLPTIAMSFRSSVYDATGPGTTNLICPDQLSCLNCTLQSSVSQSPAMPSGTTVPAVPLPSGVSGSSNSFVLCTVTLGLNATPPASFAIIGKFSSLLAKNNGAFLMAQVPVQITSSNFTVAPITPTLTASLTTPQTFSLQFTGSQLFAWMTTTQQTLLPVTSTSGYFCCPFPNQFTSGNLPVAESTSPLVNTFDGDFLFPACNAVDIDVLAPGIGIAICNYTFTFSSTLAAQPALLAPVALSYYGPIFSFNTNNTLTSAQIAASLFTVPIQIPIIPLPIVPGPVPIVPIGTSNILCSVTRCIVDIETAVTAPQSVGYTYYIPSCAWRPNGTTTANMVVPGAAVNLTVTGVSKGEVTTTIAGNTFYVTMTSITRFTFLTSAFNLNSTASSAGVLTVHGAYYNFWTNPPCWVSGLSGASNTTLATIAVQFYDPATVNAQSFSAGMVTGSSTMVSVTVPLVLGLPIAPAPPVTATNIASVATQPFLPLPVLYPKIEIQRQGDPASRMTVTSVSYNTGSFQYNGLYMGTFDIASLPIVQVGINYTVFLTPPYFDGLGVWLPATLNQGEAYPTAQFDIQPPTTTFEAACTLLPSGRTTLPRTGFRQVICTFRVDTRAIALNYVFTAPPLTAGNTSACTQNMYAAPVSYLANITCIVSFSGIAPLTTKTVLLSTNLIAAPFTGTPFTHSLRTIRLTSPSQLTNVPMETFPSIIMLASQDGLPVDPAPVLVKGPVAIGEAVTQANDPSSAPSPPVLINATFTPSTTASKMYTFASNEVTWVQQGVQWEATLVFTGAELEPVSLITLTLIPALYHDGAWIYLDPPLPPNWGNPQATIQVDHPEPLPPSPTPNASTVTPATPPTYGIDSARKNAAILFAIAPILLTVLIGGMQLGSILIRNIQQTMRNKAKFKLQPYEPMVQQETRIDAQWNEQVYQPQQRTLVQRRSVV